MSAQAATRAAVMCEKYTQRIRTGATQFNSTARGPAQELFPELSHSELRDSANTGLRRRSRRISQAAALADVTRSRRRLTLIKTRGSRTTGSRSVRNTPGNMREISVDLSCNSRIYLLEFGY